MIPHGRRAVTEVELAGEAGQQIDTWRRHDGRLVRERLTVLHPGEPWVYDLAQVRALLSGRSIPKLPTDPHPDDLLAELEAAAYLGIATASLRSDASRGRRSRGRLLYGHRWWSRAELDEQLAAPPARRGRPPGAKDTQPRTRRPSEAARRASELADLLVAGQELTVPEVETRFGVNERTAQRLLKRAREEAASR